MNKQNLLILMLTLVIGTTVYTMEMESETPLYLNSPSPQLSNRIKLRTSTLIRSASPLQVHHSLIEQFRVKARTCRSGFIEMIVPTSLMIRSNLANADAFKAAAATQNSTIKKHMITHTIQNETDFIKRIVEYDHSFSLLNKETSDKIQQIIQAATEQPMQPNDIKEKLEKQSCLLKKKSVKLMNDFKFFVNKKIKKPLAMKNFKIYYA